MISALLLLSLFINLGLYLKLMEVKSNAETALLRNHRTMELYRVDVLCLQAYIANTTGYDED